MNGTARGTRRDISSKKNHLDNLVRGVYAKGAVPSGTMIDQVILTNIFFWQFRFWKGSCLVRKAGWRDIGKGH